MSRIYLILPHLIGNFSGAPNTSAHESPPLASGSYYSLTSIWRLGIPSKYTDICADLLPQLPRMVSDSLLTLVSSHGDQSTLLNSLARTVLELLLYHYVADATSLVANLLELILAALLSYFVPNSFKAWVLNVRINSNCLIIRLEAKGFTYVPRKPLKDECSADLTPKSPIFAP